MDFIKSYLYKKEISKIYNKSILIDYLLLLKIIMKNRNIHFSNLFYIEILSYLKIKILPIYTGIINNNNYYFSDLANNVISKYNLNYLLFSNKIYSKNKSNYDYFNNDIHITISIKKNKIHEIEVFDINIIFSIFSNYLVKKIENYQYQIPIILYEYIKYNNFNIFNNIILDIWKEYMGLIMWDYFISNDNIKYIYYELYKKIIVRLL